MNAAPPAASVWLEAPNWPELGRDEVHVWRAALDLNATAIRNFEQTLSKDECAQAAKFRFPKHRRRFIARRGLIRDIIARYLGLDPAQLEFQRGPHGKPALAAWPGEDTIQFNLSYSHGLALFAIASGREIGH